MGGFFPSANITTYYGARYQYYSGKYQRGAGQAYRTEYVFLPDGENGILMFLYLYPNDNKYLSEGQESLSTGVICHNVFCHKGQSIGDCPFRSR